MRMHRVVQRQSLRAVAACEMLPDRGAPHRRAGIGHRRLGRLSGQAGQLRRGASIGLGQPTQLAVVVVLQFGGTPDQRLALTDDPAVERILLARDMPADRIVRLAHLRIEPRAQHRPRALVARPVQRRDAQPVQAVEDIGQAGRRHRRRSAAYRHRAR
ncbi:MAG: hypothetical protein QM784_05595 [Polyangiaceae bacterium]